MKGLVMSFSYEEVFDVVLPEEKTPSMEDCELFTAEKGKNAVTEVAIQMQEASSGLYSEIRDLEDRIERAQEELRMACAGLKDTRNEYYLLKEIMIGVPALEVGETILLNGTQHTVTQDMIEEDAIIDYENETSVELMDEDGYPMFTWIV